MAFRDYSRRILAFSHLFLMLPVALAQNAQITGIISDPQKAIISDAKITILNLATQEKISVSSNSAGAYSIPSLPPAKYRITVSATGFETQVIDDVTAAVAGKLSMDIVLHPGNISQSVTVDGSALSLNTTDATVSTVIDRQFVENVPLNGRSFQSLMTLAPGVAVVPSSGVGYSGEISVNGQRTEANYFTVDGVSANTGTAPSADITGWGGGFSGSTPGNSVLGTTQTMVSIDALQEFRASTSTYSAEYGRMPGGQFSFTTRSGTDHWHGSLFDYFRNDALDANNWFSNYTGTPRPAERQNDFGGTFGGRIPIPYLYRRNQSFFFFSYEGLRLRIPHPAIVTDVPTLAMRQNTTGILQTVLSSFPISNGPDEHGLSRFTSGYSAPSSLDSTSIRADHHFSDRFSVFGRFATTPSSTKSRSSTNLANVFSLNVNAKTLTLGATNLLNSRISNEFRFNSTWTDSFSTNSVDSFGGATPFALNSIPGMTGKNPQLYMLFSFGAIQPSLTLTPQSTQQNQINVVETLNVSLGHHALKFGVDYRRIANTGLYPSVYEWPTFSSVTNVVNNIASITAMSFATDKLLPVFMNFSAFAQDEWHFNPRLNFSLGLRWDLAPTPGDAGDRPQYALTSTDVATMKLAPAGTKLWETRYMNFAPRIGLAYRIHQNPAHGTVLRSGFGLFYDTTGTTATEGYWGVGYRASQSFTTSFPLTEAQLTNVPVPSIQTPYNNAVYAYDPHLRSPYVMEWNASLDQQFGNSEILRINYVGSGSRLLLNQSRYTPSTIGNTNFGSWVYLSRNALNASYHALQTQIQRQMSHGLELLASYTWSHAIDDATSNFLVYVVQRASSDYDIRHNAQVALSYNLPTMNLKGFLPSLINDWSVDGRFSARSAVPVDIQGALYNDPTTGQRVYFHPDRVRSESLYVSDSSAPGGRRINYLAFTNAPTGAEGNAGRNSARGFNATQLDLTLRRDIHLTETVGLQFRAEAFNIFNHPIFGSIYNQLSNGADLFGRAYNTQNTQLGGLNSLYQVGGPRSMQLALRLHF